MAIAGTAVLRATNALLRALGGDLVVLVLPLPTGTGGPSAELGLSDPGVQTLPLSPVVVRALPSPSSGPRRRLEFLLSASAVADAVEAEGADSADALFNLALGVQYQADLFHIESFSAEFFAGTAYLYRVIAVE
jgi:hypothetical protein